MGCDVCGQRAPVFHHVRYDFPMYQRLCFDCHSLIHRIAKRMGLPVKAEEIARVRGHWRYLMISYLILRLYRCEWFKEQIMEARVFGSATELAFNSSFTFLERSVGSFIRRRMR